MIQEVTMYTVICDNCGKDVNKDAEFSCWNEKGYAEECAKNADWIEDDDKHYCDDCFSYDENDNIVLKQITNKK